MKLRCTKGLFTTRERNGSPEVFKLLAPNSLLLKGNTSGFDAQNKYFSLGIDNSVISLIAGLKFNRPQNTNTKARPQLRIGLTYLSRTSIRGSLYQRDNVPYDTLFSANTGNIIYVDSVIINSYSMSYTSEQLRLDLSLIYRTDPTSRWSFFYGAGLMGGYSLSAQTEIYYNNYGWSEARLPFGSGYTSGSFTTYDDTNSREVFKNQREYGFSAFIPLGIDFRIGNKSKILSQMHLFYEFRLGIDFQAIPSLGNYIMPFNQNAIGLRYSWN